MQLFADSEVLQERYRIVRQLGQGGMGAVYEALDQRLQVTVAIKETFAVDDRLRRQFEREARLLAQLSHPALPRVSDYFTENGGAFLVMQFIAGDDLAEIISAQPGPFPRAQVIAWADQLLDALIYLHTRERQIIHRDIKPHNLKVAPNGQIALLDFGLAKTHPAADHSTTQSYISVFGFTRRYSPLEQIQDQGTSPQSDIYALGATLFHLLTGIKPPDALARAAALAGSRSDPLLPANVIQSAVGPDLAEVLAKAMALNASDRFETAFAFREALRQISRNEVIPRAATVNPRVIAEHKTRSASVTTDPFDTYSILRPEDELFRLSSRKHAPAIFAAGLAVVLIAITIAYPGQATNSGAGMMDSATRASDAAALPVPRSEPARPSLIKSAANAPAGVIKRSSDTKKRSAQTGQSLRRNSVKPPPFSVAP